jgi:hypothetical protein
MVILPPLGACAVWFAIVIRLEQGFCGPGTVLTGIPHLKMGQAQITILSGRHLAGNCSLREKSTLFAPKYVLLRQKLQTRGAML